MVVISDRVIKVVFPFESANPLCCKCNFGSVSTMLFGNLSLLLEPKTWKFVLK